MDTIFARIVILINANAVALPRNLTPIAATKITTCLYLFSYHFLLVSMILYNKPDNVMENMANWRSVVRYRGRSQYQLKANVRDTVKSLI